MNKLFVKAVLTFSMLFSQTSLAEQISLENFEWQTLTENEIKTYEKKCEISQSAQIVVVDSILLGAIVIGAGLGGALSNNGKHIDEVMGPVSKAASVTTTVGIPAAVAIHFYQVKNQQDRFEFVVEKNMGITSLQSIDFAENPRLSENEKLLILHAENIFAITGNCGSRPFFTSDLYEYTSEMSVSMRSDSRVQRLLKDMSVVQKIVDKEHRRKAELRPQVYEQKLQEIKERLLYGVDGERQTGGK